MKFAEWYVKNMTFCGLWFAVSHERPDAKGLYCWLNIATYSQEVPFLLAEICNKSLGAYKRKPVID